MTYSDFCKKFYEKRTSFLIGVTSQAGTARFFLSIFLPENLLEKEESYFTKVYAGTVKPKKLFEKMSKDFDDNYDLVSGELSEKIRSSMYDELAKSFGISTDEGLRREEFVYALTSQLKELADGNGKAENIVAKEYALMTSADFPVYRKKVEEKYSKIFTLLYANEERPFDEFFVCNEIRQLDRDRHYHSPKYIKDATLPKLKAISPFIMLTGMGGLGKSMMMRHLLLESLRHPDSDNTIPILIPLRGFGPEHNNLFELIQSTVKRFDKKFTESKLKEKLNHGQCQLLLDGLDEIKQEFVPLFETQLDELIDSYTDCQYVVSTRRYTNYKYHIPRFHLLGLTPFSKDQALELIDKLVFYPHDPDIKKKFREKLDEELYNTHRQFAENPLLLTLMLMNYKNFSDVPKKRYLFYEEAYNTLLRRHDNNKTGGYSRQFHSVDDPSYFTELFSEFCAKSYRKGRYDFNIHQIDEFLGLTKFAERRSLPPIKTEDFLYDACQSTCIMYKEGESYIFLHRSFQEYFFAEYYSRQDDRILHKVGESLDKRCYDHDISSAMDMLYEISPERVQRWMILPVLEDIFEKKDSYLRFLNKTYRIWHGRSVLASNGKVKSFEITHRIMRDMRDILSATMSLIFGILGQSKLMRFPVIKPEPELDKWLIHIYLWDATEEMKHRIIHLRDVEPVESKLQFVEEAIQKYREEEGEDFFIEKIYYLGFDYIMDHKDETALIINSLEDETSNLYKAYLAVQNYYLELKSKFNKEELDDDNF